MTEKNTHRPRALVIGGSLGGLFAATALHAIGWQVDIYERSAGELDSRGGGLVLQPEVLAAFRFAGITHAGALGVASGDRIYLDRQGEVVQRSFMPQTQTSWNMLYTTMKKALPADALHPGEELLSFEQHGQKVTAHFAGGREETGDLLIGADGPRSTMRSRLLPSVLPRYAGYVAWRGLVAEDALADEAAAVLDGSFAFQQGDDHQLLEYMVPGEDGSVQPGGRRWNWVWYRKVAKGTDLQALLTDRQGVRHAFSLPPGGLQDRYRALLNEDARTMLALAFQQLVEATNEPFVQAILDLQVPRMVFGRAVLLGDAAFVPRPHTAGSTAKAAANALRLAENLQRTSFDIDLALASWQASQLGDGMAMTSWGRDMGNRIMKISM